MLCCCYNVRSSYKMSDNIEILLQRYRKIGKPDKSQFVLIMGVNFYFKINQNIL